MKEANKSRMRHVTQCFSNEETNAVLSFLGEHDIEYHLVKDNTTSALAHYGLKKPGVEVHVWDKDFERAQVLLKKFRKELKEKQPMTKADKRRQRTARFTLVILALVLTYMFLSTMYQAFWG